MTSTKFHHLEKSNLEPNSYRMLNDIPQTDEDNYGFAGQKQRIKHKQEFDDLVFMMRAYEEPLI